MLKAVFPQGVTELTVNGLHQWDYGQQLEIEASDLPAMVEVHFACVGMQSAEVRTCSAVSGTLVVSIPDLCLEQIAPIVAWVFAINGNEGATVKTITLPIIPRVKPQIEASIPRDNTDAYTQFLTEVNNAVGSLKAGDVTVGHALNADNADNADNAAHANAADEAHAVLTGDAASTAGHLDNLFTNGRYYCDWSIGTPTGSYGIVDVFHRFELTVQVFYNHMGAGSADIYVRKHSGDKWTEWSSRTHNAWRSTYAERFDIVGVSYGTTISSEGLYLVEWGLDSGLKVSGFLFISDINRNACSTEYDGSYVQYDSYSRCIVGRECAIKNVFKLGNYSISSGDLG